MPRADIISLTHGFNYLDSLGGITAVQRHTEALRAWAFEALTGLRHSNGAPIVRVFGKHSAPGHAEVQGPILNFQVGRAWCACK